MTGAAEIIGIEVLDHVILGDGYFSMKEHGMLSNRLESGRSR